MAGNNIHYDTKAMRTAADNIMTELGKYNTSKKNVDDTVEGMKSYWDDVVNQNYVRKYKNDMEPTATGVGNLMKGFAQFLRDSADAIDKAQNSGNAGING